MTHDEDVFVGLVAFEGLVNLSDAAKDYAIKAVTNMERPYWFERLLLNAIATAYQDGYDRADKHKAAS